MSVSGKKEEYINSYEVERFIRQLTTLVWKKPEDAKKCEEVLLKAFAQRDAEINRLEQELKKHSPHEIEPDPNPGSAEAKNRGCDCPSRDNAFGRGAWGRTDVFWIVENCPLHGRVAGESDVNLLKKAES